MADVDPTAEPKPAGAKPRRGKAATRVDAAHRVASDVGENIVPMRSEVAEPVVAAVPAEETAVATTIKQVRTQAAQLATHLQRQQATVDHRESELNARLASMENEIRAARLWLNQRHDELAARTSLFDERQRELEQREAALTATSDNRKPRKAKPSTAVPDESRLAELDRRQAELDALSVRLSDRFSTVEHARDFEHAMRALEARSQNLQKAEKLLAEERTQLKHQHEMLVQQRAQFSESMQADRARLAEEQQTAAAEQAQAQADLERQCGELAAQQRTLEAMRGEIMSTQQEALELRLVTEETWAKLCGRHHPAMVAQTIAQLRLRLAEEHRHERAELAQQRGEVQSLADRLAEQHQKWNQQRDDMQAWVVQRQQDFERQAATLVAASSQLEEQRAEMCEERTAWQFERSRLLAEIRGLLSMPQRTNLAA
jgi:DNA repair exonuclease SbcCD ATPase subunit